MTDNRIASIVRALAERVDPGRVLRDVVNGATGATASGHGVLAAIAEGIVTPLVAVGALYPVLVDAAARVASSGTPARMSDPALGLEAVAVPVRLGGRVVAALVIAAPPATVEPTTLLPFADCAALALGAGPAGGHPDAAGGVGMAEALARVSAPGDRDGVLAAALDAAETCFGARSAFVCLLEETDDGAAPGGASSAAAEVACYRGFDRERLLAAVHHPDFARLVTPERSEGSPSTIVPPTDPVLTRLTEGAEFGVSLGLSSGAVVLLVASEPAAEDLRALEAYRLQVNAALRSVSSRREARATVGAIASVVHAIAEPALAIDPTGCFTAVNGAAAELFALSEPFEIGRSARGRLGHPGIEAMLLGEAGATEMEVTLGRPEARRWRVVTRRIGAPGEKPAGRLLLLRDAAPRRQGDESEFIAAVGRELRLPVAGVRSQLAQAAAGGTDGALAAIGAEADAIEALVEQLALLGRGPESAVVARPTARDVVALVRSVAEDYRARHPDRGVIVTARPARLEVSVDARLFERALRPLIDNALRYSDGLVGVEVVDRGDTYEVAVVDAGPGIFSGDVPGLFERFHPLDGSPTRHGAGLGLYCARRLVEALEGRIWCDSRLGVGSRFAFRLPHAPAEVLR